MPVTRLLLFTKKINTITHNNKMTNPPDSSTISDVTPTDPVPKHVVILEGCRLFTVLYFPIRSFSFFSDVIGMRNMRLNSVHWEPFSVTGEKKVFVFFSGIRINTPE